MVDPNRSFHEVDFAQGRHGRADTPVDAENALINDSSEGHFLEYFVASLEK